MNTDQNQDTLKTLKPKVVMMNVVPDSPQNPQAVVVHVPYHQHPLKPVDPRFAYQSFGGYWKCDNCNKESGPMNCPYNCIQCSYDLCQECIKGKSTLAHEHPLYLVNSSELLYQTTRGVWRCDACRRTNLEIRDTHSYHCSLCEFDLCQFCFSEHQHPMHMHPLRVANTNLVYAHTGGNWVCDFCRKTSRSHERYSHHCVQCEFDACHNCFREHNIPSHPHPLVRADANFVYLRFNGGWRCDNCGSLHSSALQDNKPWHCQQCEYDLCNNCMRQLDPDCVPDMDVSGPPPGNRVSRSLTAVRNPHQERMRVAPQPNEPKPPADYKSERGNTIASPEDTDDSELCIICLEQPKNATLIHGDTGHLCCCWSCAQVLKRRGDHCPICRSPIDHVIRQFNA